MKRHVLLSMFFAGFIFTAELALSAADEKDTFEECEEEDDSPNPYDMYKESGRRNHKFLLRDKRRRNLEQLSSEAPIEFLQESVYVENIYLEEEEETEEIREDEKKEGSRRKYSKKLTERPRRPKSAHDRPEIIRSRTIRQEQPRGERQSHRPVSVSVFVPIVLAVRIMASYR
jgi:hypothetical protein